MKTAVCPVPPPDGGWGWVVMVASFFNTAAIFGILKSGGVIYVAIVNELHVTRTQASFVPSLAFSISCLIGPLASSACSHFSHRSVIFAGALVSASGVAMAAFFPSLTNLTLFYGIFMGIGSGLMILPNIIIVYHYFDRHRSFASAFSMAGGSIGCFAVPPFFEWVNEKYGLPEGLLALSAIFLQICPVALLLRPLETSRVQKKKQLEMVEKNGYLETPHKVDMNGKQEDEVEAFLKPESLGNGVQTGNESINEKRTMLQRFLSVTAIDPTIFKEKYFYLVSFSSVCFTYSWLSYLTMLPDYVITEALEPVSPRMAALLFSFMSLGDLVFRIIGGWLMDRKWVNRRYAYSLFLTGLTVLMFSYIPSHGYSALVAITVIFGVVVSGIIILPAILLIDQLGPVRFPMAFGICTAINGFVIFFAGPSIAYLREVRGSYKPCILVMALCMFCAALSWIIDSVYTHLRKPSTPEDNVNV